MLILKFKKRNKDIIKGPIWLILKKTLLNLKMLFDF